MKYFAKKSQNGCSFNKHLHGCQEHLEIMTYNDCVGRLLNLTFQNLDSSPQAEEDENLQTDRQTFVLCTDLTSPSWSICYWPHSVTMDQMEAGSNSSQKYPHPLYWNTIHSFSDTTNTTCWVIVPQFPHRIQWTECLLSCKKEKIISIL